jgi:ATP-dependent DNA helicase RecQ
MIEQELERYFGFGSFRTGQREVIERVVGGRSAAAIFPTGAGKSLCYQLPALLPHTTLVVSPLLALMKDQIDFLTSRRIPAARLDSTLTTEEYGGILGRAKGGALKILLISVERFHNERFRSHLQKMKTSLLVVDEAQCISEWGHCSFCRSGRAVLAQTVQRRPREAFDFHELTQEFAHGAGDRNSVRTSQSFSVASPRPCS